MTQKQQITLAQKLNTAIGGFVADDLILGASYVVRCTAAVVTKDGLCVRAASDKQWYLAGPETTFTTEEGYPIRVTT